MIWFRCYSCWHLVGYEGSHESINCIQCNANLFTGALPMKTIHNTKAQSKEHESLLHGLRVTLVENSEIYEGTSEFIAAETVRHKPNAIYYRNGSANATQPIIYEVLTGNLIIDENVISRYKLFAATAQNRFSHFYLVMLGSRENKHGSELAEKILEENGIHSAKIMILDEENLK